MSQSSFKINLGVDIAKQNFDAASLIDGKYKIKNEPGFRAFVSWFIALCEAMFYRSHAPRGNDAKKPA